MIRSTFKRPSLPEQKPRPWPERVSVGAPARISVDIKPRPKAVLLRDKDYRMAVASLPCFNCGIEGYSQAAHADEGKGLGMKSSDSTVYPLCADRPGTEGCHSRIGAKGIFSREARREFEKAAAEWTRVQLGLSE